MKVKHIPGFRRWMKEVIDFHPTYNDVKYFNRMYKLYTRKFR
jgi:hypothetical protein